MSLVQEKKAPLHPQIQGEALLHQLFEEQADRCPGAVALITDDRELTYQELEENANRLAHYLRSRKVKPGDLIGLYGSRSETSIIAILGILKAGAGYVPIDPAFPEERISHILEDAKIETVLTLESLSSGLAKWDHGRKIFLDHPITAIEIADHPETRCNVEHSDKNLCYVIYTSGTTGKPKGVMTEHRNTVLFVQAFNEVCNVREDDRIFHGFSLGFDGSVEEMWLAFSNGASLIVGPHGPAALGNEVATFINRHRATFYSTVPTALSMISKDLETVRVLIVSGEQCPPELVSQWARKGRRMLNVYGPTEATVNTTVAECVPDKPITIGKPLRGYSLYLLGENKKPVPDGSQGELYVGGETLARGYLNLPEVTSKAFMEVSLGEGATAQSHRLYRTGDLVQMDKNGDLLFHGRIDTQVKIRGYRIELAEIETLLLEQEAIQSAVVKVVDHEGARELAAYVVLCENEDELDRTQLHQNLKGKLPVYMLPKFLDVLPQLPTLSSGKVNRHALPCPTEPLMRRSRDANAAPKTEMEKITAEIWSTFFSSSELHTSDDFFTDLGGHSMLAAQMVTKIRHDLKLDVPLREVYRHPTLGKLAGYLETLEPHEEATCATEEKTETCQKESRTKTTGGLSRPSVALVQAIGIYLLYAIPATVLLSASYCTYLATIHWGLATTGTIGLIAGIAFGLFPLFLFLSIAVKWVVIGRYRPGEYPVGSWYYIRWWFVMRFQIMSGARALSGTPLLSLYFRLMGAKLGKHCIIDTTQLGVHDLISIGDRTCVGNESQLLGYRVENGILRIGSINIGKDCFIGIHSTVGLNVTMGDDSKLDNLSLLPDNASIAKSQSQGGSPAAPAEVALPDQTGETPRRKPVLFGFLHLLLIYVIQWTSLAISLPVLFLIYQAYLLGGWGLATASLLVAGPLGILSFCLYVVIAKHLVMPRTRPGTYSVESWFYLRKWFIDSLFRTSRIVALPLFTTIYFPTWLRLLGARIGRYAEISTVSQFTPDLMRLGEQSFFADGSIIGGRRFYDGLVEVGLTEVGDRSFIGNSAMLPIGRPVGHDSLIGCLSLPPGKHDRTPDGTDWLGSPSFALPRRQKVGNFDPSVTYRPTIKLILQRCLVDAMRIIFPSVLGIAAASLFLVFLVTSYFTWGAPITIALAPIVTIALGLCASLLVVVFKKVLMGTIKPGVHPLWSMFVWLNEAVNGAYESIASPTFIPMLGTPFFAPYLRLLGCKVGNDVYLETTLFSEFDLVEIGDHVALNAGAVIQNHLFEDRVMKASDLKISDHCTVGNMAVVLYDTEMEPGSSLDPLSLLMKGEVLPEDTHWSGIPTSRTNR